jgi:superfamily II DNA or RNA helicase
MAKLGFQEVHVFVPRPYQQQAVDEVLSRRQVGKRKLLLHLPTGAGKTVIAALLIDRLLRLPGAGRVLFLAHRKEIIDQTAEKIATQIGAEHVGVEQADRSAGKSQVVVASVQSIHQRLDDFKPSEFSAVIVDECHHIFAKSWLETVAHFQKGSDTLLVGLTATPQRTDGRSADRFFEEVAFEITLGHLQDLGYLVPMEYHTIETSLGLDLVGIAGNGDFQASGLSAVMNTPEARGLAMRAWKEKASRLKTIMFCASVAHADQMRRDFEAEGVRAALITGTTKNRDHLLASFRRGGIQVITNFGVLTEGFDDPSIECVLLARPTTSPLVYNQCLGRGLRSHPGKKLCSVIDIIDRSAHRLQYTAYEAAGFPAGWKPTGKDPLREAMAVAAIRVRNPAAFLRIKKALSLAETQSILMSLPDAEVLGGIGGQPLVRYKPATEGLPKAEAFHAAMDVIEKFGLKDDLVSLIADEHQIRARLHGKRKAPPEFLDFHIKNATGWPLDLSLETERVRQDIDEIEGERLKEKNPKGRLLELEQIKLVKRMDMNVAEASIGFQASGEVLLADAYLRSAVHHSRTKKKHAEQSLAAELFNFAVSRSKSTAHRAFVLNPRTSPPSIEAEISPIPAAQVRGTSVVEQDARQKIHEMVQKGIFSGFEYVEDQRGPDNQRVFFCTAKVLSGHGWISGRRCSSHTKKGAQAAAAADLFQQLIERSKRFSVQDQMKAIRQAVTPIA